MQLGLEKLEYAYQSSIFKHLNIHAIKQLLKSETINLPTKNIIGLRHVSDVQLFMCRTNALKTINNEVVQGIVFNA